MGVPLSTGWADRDDGHGPKAVEADEPLHLQQRGETSDREDDDDDDDHTGYSRAQSDEPFAAPVGWRVIED